jgi:hypothetical protein
MDAMGETMIFLPRITLPMTAASGCTYVDGSITGSETFLQKSAVTFFSIIFASVFYESFAVLRKSSKFSFIAPAIKHMAAGSSPA